jgi:hypothetical protein
MRSCAKSRYGGVAGRFSGGFAAARISNDDRPPLANEASGTKRWGEK